MLRALPPFSSSSWAKSGDSSNTGHPWKWGQGETQTLFHTSVRNYPCLIPRSLLHVFTLLHRERGMRKVFLLLPLPDQLGKFIPSSPTHALSTGALQTPLITLHQFTSEDFKKLEERKMLGKGFSEGPEACDERAASELPTHLSGAVSI